MSNMVTLTTFDNSLEAHIFKGLLESEAIPVFLVGEHFFNAQSLLNVGLAHIRLQVPSALIGEAKQVLADFNKGEFEKPLVETFSLSPEVCPKCGCAETGQTLSYSSFLANAALALLYIGVMMKPIKSTICTQCKCKID
ncbi:MAG: DUF2007 domain-containing protein [Methylotenera sp.]